MLVLKNVSKQYGKNTVLNNVSCQIDPKEFVCITGPSGAGKSTFLHHLIGAEEPSQGTVLVDGVDLKAIPLPILQLYRRRIGVVFQDYKLLWNQTVAENVAFPLDVSGVPSVAIEQRTNEVLRALDLEDKANELARSLSGGEKARTAIARAIVHRPIMLFADEPTGNLDPGQTKMILDLFQDIHQQGTTVVLATHEVAIVDSLQTRVLRLEDGELIRDGVGGYENEKRMRRSTSSKAAKHDIFDDDVSVEVTGKKKPGGSTKKVKVVRTGE